MPIRGTSIRTVSYTVQACRYVVPVSPYKHRTAPTGTGNTYKHVRLSSQKLLATRTSPSTCSTAKPTAPTCLLRLCLLQQKFVQTLLHSLRPYSIRTMGSVKKLTYGAVYVELVPEIGPVLSLQQPT